ncbi:MAG: hypothetical protein JO127_03910 [Caulobacteraceae bacterium]|nr:hypothetical protein [Caulobacteraceae bacterium]
MAEFIRFRPTSALALPPAADQDFSLVLGGPLFQMLRRVGLSDDKLGLAHRRLLASIAITWAPLVVLSALQGRLVGPRSETPFLYDVGFQLRFLVVAPLLILAELTVHRRMRPIVDEFGLRGLVRTGQADRFAQALGEAARWRNAIPAEVSLLAIVYAAGLPFAMRRYLAMGDGWYAAPAAGSGLSLAGLWLVFVSLPLLQFLVLRWYFRLLIWARFLWRVSRLDLDLNVTHPDKAGGLGFLAESLSAFVPIAAAHGMLMAGTIVDRLLYAKASLTDFQLEVVCGALVLTLVFAGPLTVFGPRLAQVKRLGLRQYGAVGQTYVQEFRRKWIEGGAPADEPLVGSGDIQSLADLGNSFGTAEQMRIAPIRPTALLYFLAAFLAPIAPLVLAMMPAEQLIGRLVGMVF